MDKSQSLMLYNDPNHIKVATRTHTNTNPTFTIIYIYLQSIRPTHIHGISSLPPTTQLITIDPYGGTYSFHAFLSHLFRIT